MTSITPLEGVDSSSRLLRTSIYLRNSLQNSDGTVQDLLDCVAPIVSDCIEKLPAGQIVPRDLQEEVLNRFSFKMPLFSIEHILGRLAQSEKITYEKDQKAYYHAGSSSSLNTNEEISAGEKIVHLENRFSEYAKEFFRIEEPPFFSNWSDVIVYFLHPDAIHASQSIRKIKGALVSDFDDIVRKLASSFILHCEDENDQQTFSIVTEVYGGILFGDFLQNIQSTGDADSFKALTVIYDTTVLLRLLGCSGSELRAATMEMHRDLQSLGCKTEFLNNNETELSNILDTIIGRYDSGQAVYGETGEALAMSSNGIQIGTVRELNNGYPEALAALGVFPSKYNFQNTKTNNYYQIDEIKFQNMLAGDRDQQYNEQSRICDAQSLAVVMRLRQNSNSYDLAASRFVFVTANSHFARTARYFVRRELNRSPQYVPPILTHAQMSTAAWISSEIKLKDSAISRELLASCMSAQKLSKAWVDGFVDIMKDTKLADAENTIIHAVRSIARDESLGNPTILRKLNPNEILKRAKIAEEKRKNSLEEKHREDLVRNAKESKENARQEERQSINERLELRSERIADGLVRTLELILAVPCVYILVIGFGNVDFANYKTWFQPFVFVMVTVVAALDLFQFQPVRRLTNPIRRRLKRMIHRTLYGE